MKKVQTKLYPNQTIKSLVSALQGQREIKRSELQLLFDITYLDDPEWIEKQSQIEEQSALEMREKEETGQNIEAEIEMKEEEESFNTTQTHLLEKIQEFKNFSCSKQTQYHENQEQKCQKFFLMKGQTSNTFSNMMNLVKIPQQKVKRSLITEESLKVLLEKVLKCIKGFQIDEKVNQTLDELIEARTVCVLKKIPQLSVLNYKLLQRIIPQCQSFKKWFSFGKRDINLMKQEYSSALILNLTFDPMINLEIYNELMKNPMSNMVASCESLTERQKIEFFTNMIPYLKKYAEILFFNESREAQITKEIENIVQKLSQDIVHLEKIIDLVLNFQFDKILDYRMVEGIRQDLYFFVRKQCPLFKQEFFKRKFEVPEDLQLNNLMILTFELRSTFLDIQLPLQDWQDAEKKILSKRYGVIDSLRLSPKGKCELWLFVVQKIDSFFFSSQNHLNKIHKLKCMVLDILMAQNDPDQRKSFRKLLSITEQTTRKMIAEKSMSFFEVKEETKQKLNISQNDLIILIKECEKDEKQIFEKIKKLKIMIYQTLSKQEKYIESYQIDKIVEKYVKNNYRLPQNLKDDVINWSSFEVELQPPFISDSSIINKVNVEISEQSMMMIHDKKSSVASSAFKKEKEKIDEEKDKDNDEDNSSKSQLNQMIQEIKEPEKDKIDQKILEQFREKLKQKNKDTTIKMIIKSQAKKISNQAEKTQMEMKILEIILKDTVQEHHDLFKGPQKTKLLNEMRNREVVKMIQEYREICNIVIDKKQEESD